MLDPTTIVVRLLISATLIGLFAETRDPFFLVVLTVVVVGTALTGASDLADQRRAVGPA